MPTPKSSSDGVSMSVARRGKQSLRATRSYAVPDRAQTDSSDFIKEDSRALTILPIRPRIEDARALRPPGW